MFLIYFYMTPGQELLQSLRKAEQENDSLNFRNQQLTCRLTLLQDDLQQYQVPSYWNNTLPVAIELFQLYFLI